MRVLQANRAWLRRIVRGWRTICGADASFFAASFLAAFCFRLTLVCLLELCHRLCDFVDFAEGGFGFFDIAECFSSAGVLADCESGFDDFRERGAVDAANEFAFVSNGDESGFFGDYNDYRVSFFGKPDGGAVTLSERQARLVERGGEREGARGGEYLAILIMNLFVPLIEKYTIRIPYGMKKIKKKS